MLMFFSGLSNVCSSVCSYVVSHSITATQWEQPQNDYYLLCFNHSPTDAESLGDIGTDMLYKGQQG